MTDWLEFHDSILTAIGARDTQVELLLDAYIHRWERLNDDWRGTGWMQSVRIVMDNAIGPVVVSLLPREIADGRMQLGTAPSTNIVRLPLQASGRIGIWLQLTTAEVVDLTGSAVCIEATADARFIEELPADMRPHDPGGSDRTRC
jgi:hypothetical protein